MIGRAMTARGIAVALLMPALASGVACDVAPGREGLETYVAPDKVLDFERLYGANCAGCHGAGGRGGAALGLANPTYLALASDDVIRRTVSDGIPGTPMPAFGTQLNDADIAALVTYERNSFGNQTGDIVQPSAVKAARAK